MTRRHGDPPALDVEDLRRKRRRYEALRNLLAFVVVASVLGLLVLTVILLGEVKSTAKATERLAAQGRTDATIERAENAERRTQAEERFRKILAAQQAELDEVDVRNVARLQLILDTIRRYHGGGGSVRVLPPTPTRTPAPAPAPRALPAPSPCEKAGKSDRCK